MDSIKNNLLVSLEKKLDKLSLDMEKMKLAEYVDLLEHTKKLLYINFISGVARGLGIAVGFAVLGALMIYLLRWLQVLNIPVIGGFIAEIIKIVQLRL